MAQSLVGTAPHSTERRSAAVDWSEYAAVYDLLLDHNPAYLSLLDRFWQFLDGDSCPAQTSRIIDIGAGTGNFAQIAARRFSVASLTVLEPDAAMRAAAMAKLGESCTEVEWVGAPFEAYRPTERFDLLICSHALYAMPEPTERLRQMAEMASDGARLFIVDFGRQLRIWDWKLYLLTGLLRRNGLGETARIVRRAKVFEQQNRQVAARQRAGEFWLHTPESFAEALAAAGWRILQQETVYRGYSQLAVCEKG